MASLALAKGLRKAGASIDLISINSDKHFKADSQIAEFRDIDLYDEVKVNALDTRVSASGAVKNMLIDDTPYFISRFYSKQIEEGIVSQISKENYDLVILDHLNVAPYLQAIKEISNISVVIRAHNVEYELRQRMHREKEQIIKRTLLKKEIKKLKGYEIEVLNRADIVLTVSLRDKRILQKAGLKSHVICVPIGIEIPEFRAIDDTGVFKIGFIGSLDWQPNIEGLNWFVQKVLSSMEEIENGAIEVHVAGSYGEAFKWGAQVPGLKMRGQVPNSAEFIQEMNLMIVPIWSGSGTRVKIIEAMSLCIPVLSTHLGAEGIEVVHGEHIMMSDTASGWKDHIRNLMSSVTMRQMLSRHAYSYVSRNHDEIAIGKMLYNYFV